MDETETLSLGPDPMCVTSESAQSFCAMICKQSSSRYRPTIKTGINCDATELSRDQSQKSNTISGTCRSSTPTVAIDLQDMTSYQYLIVTSCMSMVIL